MKVINSFCLILSAFAVVSAQSAWSRGVDVHSFSPAVNPTYMYTEDAFLGSAWGLQSTETKRKLYFGAIYDLVNDPLVELNAERTDRTSTLVESANSLNLALSYGVLSQMQVGVASSLALVNMPNGASEFGFGDTRVFSKYRLNRQTDPVVFAIMPELWIPTGRSAIFMSNDSVNGGARLVAERDFGRAQVAGNIGYRYSPNATYRDLNMKNRIPLALGVFVPIQKTRWGINADASAALTLPFNSNQNPSTLYVGARYRLPTNLMFTAGASVGSLNGYSSANYQLVAGLKMIPEPMQAVVVKKAAPAPVVSGVEKVRVIFTPKELIIKDEVKFKHAKAELTNEGKNLLDEVASVLREHKGEYKKITIEGHTNRLGSATYNQKLSENRAAAVKAYLVEQGIEPQALRSAGYGKSRPKKFKHKMTAEEELAANRRVEFKVTQ